MSSNSKRVQTLFLTALELPVHEREGYLDQECRDDADLRGRVHALLKAHDEPGSFLESPPPGLAAVTEITAVTEQPGDTIGPYKLLQQIGEGGMGTVFMAEQSQPVERRVALKIIKPGMDTRQVIARFEAERQALAMMDHPNIAKVLDAGTTDSGRPYFVMELVKGMPVTQYCDEQHLTPRERLELFVPICQAVQHAHQKGIIHRDLKPSNILIAQYDDKPVPKIIDFGVAKAISHNLTEKTMFTQYGQIVGTIEYMSPEQARFNQLDVDTRSDVYSLGVLLYELLTGETPFDKKRLRSAAFDELLRIIREEEPPRPSTKLSSSETLANTAINRKTEPKKLSLLVRGELDWIVMKALEKDRGRRYETATGFAADVLRYLNDEPVQACPPSAIYRIGKFARRNKAGLAAAGLVLFFFVLLGGGVGWAVRDRAAREVETARQQGERHAKAGGQVESIFAEVDRLEVEQKWPEALEVARRAEVIVDGGEVDTETAERVRGRLKDLEFVDRLEQSRMRGAMIVEGKFDDAGAMREYARAFREYGVDVEALAVEASIERLKARPALAIRLAAALDDWITAGHWPSGQGVTKKRLVAVVRGIDAEPVRDRMRSGFSPQTKDEGRRLIESIDSRAHLPETLSIIANRLKRTNQLDAALRLRRDAQAAHPADFWTNFRLAQLLAEQKDYEGAVRFYTAAVSIRPNATAALCNMGVALSEQGKLDEAVANYRRAIEIDPKNAAVYSNLGIALREQKKLDEAIAAYRKAIEVDPKLAAAYSNMGIALVDQNKLDEAIASYRKAIEIDPKHAVAYTNLGAALAYQKKLDEAIAAFRKAIEFDPKYAMAHSNLGKALSEQNKLAEAIDCYRKVIEIDPKYLKAHNELAWLLATGPDGVRNGSDAVEHATEACKQTGWKDPGYLDTLAAAYAEAGDFDKAVEFQNKTLANTNEAFEKEHGKEIRERLKLYEQKKPYRDPSLAARDVAPPREVNR